MYHDPELGDVMRYAEWGGLGRHVRKGQKAHWVKIDGRGEAIPMFTEAQTAPNLPRNSRTRGDYLYGEDEDSLLCIAYDLY